MPTYQRPTVGQKAVTTAGTPERLVASSTLANWVYIASTAGNSGAVHIGDASVDYATNPGITLSTALDYIIISAIGGVPIDLSEIWIDVATSTESVDFCYVN